MNSKVMMDRLRLNLDNKHLKERTQYLPGELIEYLNEAQEYVEEQIRSVHDNYFMAATTVSTVASQELYDLPSDLVTVKKIEWVDDNAPDELVPVHFSSRNYYLQTSTTNLRNITEGSVYYLHGAKFGILPVPTETGVANIKVWYVKRLASLDGTSATTSEIPAEYHRLVVQYATVTALEKPEARRYVPDNVLQVQRERLAALIESMKKVLQDKRIEQPQFATFFERE